MSLPTPYYEDAEDGITIFHGDCREILPLLPKVDLVLTDPPYGIQMAAGSGCGGRSFGGKHRSEKGGGILTRTYEDDWDDARPGEATFQMILAQCERAIIFGGNYFADILPRSTHWLVWDKLQTMPSFSDCELAWTNVPRKSVKKKVIEWSGLLGKERERFHPTQKPIELMIWCIEQYSEPGQLILDPFGGSGTTALAAKNTGRRCISIEAEEKYVQVTAKRLGQGVLAL